MESAHPQWASSFFRARSSSGPKNKSAPAQPLARSQSTQEPCNPSLTFSSGADAAGPNGGEGGIRTPETLARLTVFKTAAFDHSATSPSQPSGLRSTKNAVGPVG